MQITSLKFPNMLSSARTETVDDSSATVQNLRLLIGSVRGSLFGDPYFGTLVSRFIHEPNSILLKDLIIDDLYTAVLTFIPQVKIDRKDIKINCERDTIYALINCINKLDGELNTLNIKLTED